MKSELQPYPGAHCVVCNKIADDHPYILDAGLYCQGCYDDEMLFNPNEESDGQKGTNRNTECDS